MGTRSETMAILQKVGLLATWVGAAAAASQTVQGWTLPADWVQGKDFVVVNTASDGTPSKFAGYIFPGPNAASSSSLSYVSPGGYYCEAKHYDHNYGIFETQDCANKWTDLISKGGEATGVSMSGCKTIPSRPCGCQGLCRPLDCSVAQINATQAGEEDNNAHGSDANVCRYYSQCRRQEELGFVTSCAASANFHVSLWFGIGFALVVAFASFSMMYMPLDMDSLLYSVGDPEKKDN